MEPQVFDLLGFLLQHRDRVVTKEELLAAVWKRPFVSNSALNTRMNAARAAVGDSGEQQRLIRTLPRKGFRFVGTVREQDDKNDGATAAVATTVESPTASDADQGVPQRERPTNLLVVAAAAGLTVVAVAGLLLLLPQL
jgi:DNA-binding winged helix-turn-helix (wHTH) protein